MLQRIAVAVREVKLTDSRRRMGTQGMELRAARIVMAGILLTLGACSNPDDGRIDNLEQELERLENEIGRLEFRIYELENRETGTSNDEQDSGKAG